MNFSVIYESYESFEKNRRSFGVSSRFHRKNKLTTTMSTVSLLVGSSASWSTKNHNQNRNIPESHQHNCVCCCCLLIDDNRSGGQQPTTGNFKKKSHTYKYRKKKSFNSFVLCSLFLIVWHQAENGKNNTLRMIFRVIKNQQISMSELPTQYYTFVLIIPSDRLRLQLFHALRMLTVCWPSHRLLHSLMLGILLLFNMNVHWAWKLSLTLTIN